MLIFFVVYGHCLYWMGEGIQEPYTFIAKFVYSFHMPLFILLSGYFFSPKKEDNIIKNSFGRFKRLIIPHFFFNFVMIVPIFLFWEQYGHFITRETNGFITVKSIYLYLTMFWFLWCVFLSSVICNIVYRTCKRYPEIICISLSLLFLALSQFIPFRFFFVHQRMSDMFFYFIIGVYLYDHNKLLNSNTILFTSFIIYISYLFILYKNYDIHPLIVEISQLCGAITIYTVIKYLYISKFALSLFLFFSKWSLGIYIYHFVLLYGIMGWFNNTFGFLNNSLVFYHILIATLSTTISAYFSKVLASFYPLSKFALGYKSISK